MIHIRPMTRDDLAFGLRLSQQAGWNQTPGDWLRCLDLDAAGCFVAEEQGVPAGTTCTCRFGPVAWVALVLVDASLRGRGNGTALMRHALEWLRQPGVETIRLDATPLGEPVYRKLGFVAEYTLLRLDGVLPMVENAEPERARSVQALTPEWWPVLLDLDRSVTGTNERGPLLRRLAGEFPEEVRLIADGDRPEGYLMARAGRLAWQLGPCLASPGAGQLLLDDTARRHAGQRVFLDIPESNSQALEWAHAHGLTVQRKLLRMYLGKRIEDDLARTWAGFGPEKG